MDPDDLKILAAVRATLRPHEWAVERLRWAGLTYPEIAARLGISRSAVAMRMLRARRRAARVRPDLLPWLQDGRQRR